MINHKASILRIIALLLLGLHLLAANIAAADTILDASRIGKEPASLTKYISVFEDPKGALKLADVQRPEIAGKFNSGPTRNTALNYGLTESAYWLRLTVRNTSDRHITRMLEISHAGINSITFYEPASDNHFLPLTTGSVPHFSTRPYRNRFFVFPITFSPNSEKVYFMRLQSTGAMIIPAKLWIPESFHDHERNDYVGQTWYLGIATAMILFNLLLYVAMREIIYLLYVGFISSSALVFACEFGLAKEYLQFESTLWPAASIIFIMISLSFFFPFMRRMLPTQRLAPRLDRLLRFMPELSLCMLVGLTISLPTFAVPALLFSMTAMALILGIGLFCAYKKQRSGILFSIAFSILGVANLATLLRAAGTLPDNVVTIYGSQIGSAIEMLLLAFALADRFNEIRLEKDAAQKLAIKSQIQALKSQTEKMASLTQLVTNVAHEINTPISSIKSSSASIASSLDDVLDNFPSVLELLNLKDRGILMRLIDRTKESADLLTTREERVLKNAVSAQLSVAGIDEADTKARALVGLGAHQAPLDYLPLLRHPQWCQVLGAAQGIGSIVNSARNIQTATDRVSKIVTTLRSFSSTDSIGKLTLTSLRDSIESVLSIYANQLKQGTQVVRRYENVPALRCYPDELVQVWTHLIHNALQAMSNAGTLTIGLKRFDNELVVSIADSGTGIPEGIRERIFEPFFTTRPAGEGAGLGLGIVKKLVSKHKGWIEVQTEVGAGSTFFVHLPL